MPELTAEGLDDPIFAGMPSSQRALQWHSVAVRQPPDGAVVLARSEVCGVQAMRIGSCAWSMQYHVEVEPDTVANWGAVPAYRDALETSLGPSALDSLDDSAAAHMGDFAANAELLYKNFTAAVARSS